ncbi:tRNA-specific 2-thiouridylase, partial [Trichophaea hybrida]
PSPSPSDKIFIALSSGVDSTVSLSLLLATHPATNIHPIYLANWSPTQHPPPATPPLGPYGKPLPTPPLHPTKCISSEFHRVKQICTHLSLPNPPQLLNFEKQYWHDVFAPMLSSYSLGRTPNPDVACNRIIKFGALANRLETIARNGRWWLATGHYARVQNGILIRSSDRMKDQTYFLSTVPGDVLKRCLFPLGAAGLTKKRVKAIAKELGIPGWRAGENTGESFGLCFVEPAGGRNSGFRRFLGEYLLPRPGKVVMPMAGTEVGEHEGLWYATVGEKAHLELPQGDEEYQGRWYVGAKDLEKNQIEVVKGGDNWALFSREMVVGTWRWLGDDAEVVALGASRVPERADGALWEPGLVTQFRHMQRPVRVKEMEVLGDGEEEGTRTIRIVFETPQKAVTAGQSTALWDGERCLGGGVIEET